MGRGDRCGVSVGGADDGETAESEEDHSRPGFVSEEGRLVQENISEVLASFSLAPANHQTAQQQKRKPLTRFY